MQDYFLVHTHPRTGIPYRMQTHMRAVWQDTLMVAVLQDRALTDVPLPHHLCCTIGCLAAGSRPGRFESIDCDSLPR